MNKPALMRYLASAIALGASAVLTAAPAAAFSLSAPIQTQNLAVYFIHGPSKSGPRLNTLDRALEAGTARVVRGAGGIKVQNLSSTALLVPFGTLLKGGSQDQVVGASQIIPPRSDLVALSTFCVDPFRSSGRSGESAEHLVATRVRIPSQSAKLSMLSGTGTSVTVGDIRQSGVWWSLETIQTRLTAALGHAPAPRHTPSWTLSDDAEMVRQLRARTGTWTNSLPLALEDRDLARLERPLEAAFRKAAAEPDVIGAAFAINGRWVGAEVVASHALFRQTWPSTLRGYAVESLVERGQPTGPVPTAGAIRTKLERAQADQRALRSADDMTVFDGGAALVAETGDRGAPVQVTFVPKLDPVAAASSPAPLIVSMLERGDVNGRSLDRLAEAPVLTRTAAHAGSATASGARWAVVAPAAAETTPTLAAQAVRSIGAPAVVRMEQAPGAAQWPWWLAESLALTGALLSAKLLLSRSAGRPSRARAACMGALRAVGDSASGFAASCRTWVIWARSRTVPSPAAVLRRGAATFRTI